MPPNITVKNADLICSILANYQVTNSIPSIENDVCWARKSNGITIEDPRIPKHVPVFTANPLPLVPSRQPNLGHHVQASKALLSNLILQNKQDSINIYQQQGNSLENSEFCLPNFNTELLLPQARQTYCRFNNISQNTAFTRDRVNEVNESAIVRQPSSPGQPLQFSFTHIPPPPMYKDQMVGCSVKSKVQTQETLNRYVTPQQKFFPTNMFLLPPPMINISQAMPINSSKPLNRSVEQKKVQVVLNSRNQHQPITVRPVQQSYNKQTTVQQFQFSAPPPMLLYPPPVFQPNSPETDYDVGYWLGVPKESKSILNLSNMKDLSKKEKKVSFHSQVFKFSGSRVSCAEDEENIPTLRIIPTSCKIPEKYPYKVIRSKDFFKNVNKEMNENRDRKPRRKGKRNKKMLYCKNNIKY